MKAGYLVLLGALTAALLAAPAMGQLQVGQPQVGRGPGPLRLGGLDAEPDPGEPLAAETVGGLKLTLTADKAAAQAGDTVKLSLVFENTGKESLRVFWPPTMVFDDYLTLRVRGPKVMRQNIMVRNMMAMIFGPGNFPEIKPGEKKTYEFTLAGNAPQIQPGNLYLCAEGEYRIQVVYSYQGGAGEDMELVEDRRGGRMDFTPWRGSVASNELVIKMTGDFAEPQPNPAGRRFPRGPRNIAPDQAAPLGGTPVEELPDTQRRLPAPETRNLPAPEVGR